MSRLLKGFNYFWNRKPSQFNKIDVVWLHNWMKLLKTAAGKKETDEMEDEDMEVLANKLFG